MANSVSSVYSSQLTLQANLNRNFGTLMRAAALPIQQQTIVDLVTHCQEGSREAHYEIYRRYSRAMLNTAYRITRDKDDAEDVLQEAFVSAFQNLENLREADGFGAWLKRIVINKAINLLKKRRWEEELPDNEDFDVEEEADDMEESDLDVRRIRSALMNLPDGYRTVLSLYLLEGYDHQEIAGILGISESTSKSQLNRSKKKLKELLKSML